ADAGKRVFHLEGSARQSTTIHAANQHAIVQKALAASLTFDVAEDQQVLKHVRRSQHAIEIRIIKHAASSPKKLLAVTHCELIPANFRDATRGVVHSCEYE